MPAAPSHDALLANPYFSALCTAQASYAIGGPLAKRYPADVIPFAGIADASPAALAALYALLTPGESLYVTSPVELTHPGLQPILQLQGLQMIFPPGTPIPAPTNTPQIKELHPHHVPEMLALKAIAFPGYFGPRAASLGSFFGIRVEGSLVAMAGERLRLPNLCEISAVCTHPQHLGQGYAAALVAHLLRAHVAQGIQSFLQATAANTRAIALYQRLGFTKTREITWHQLQRLNR